MNLRIYKVYQTSFYLLLISFSLEGCLFGEESEVERRKREELAQEKAKKHLLTIEPLAGFEKGDLIKLEEYIAANYHLNTVAIPSTNAFPDVSLSPIITAGNTSDTSTTQHRSFSKIKEEKGKEKQGEEQEEKEEKTRSANIYSKIEQRDSPLHMAINHPNMELTEHLVATKLNHIRINDIDHLNDGKLQ
ncbi:hypothetical protein [Candidatus Amoebophilus asiaticus]|uniref:hypothetical protein n=1 Tax=Candidatus Amoebophilus asiaticus TaxID=281120 RepID=UPI000171587E|nr:hypothetical protein [Candidatus Amoebophilus asiaticus]